MFQHEFSLDSHAELHRSLSMVAILTEELLDDPEALRRSLADRIEEVERTLHDDEDFCEQELVDTYAAARSHVESLEEQLRARLDAFRHELDRIREANRTTTEKNRKQLHEHVDAVNRAFTSENYRQGRCQRISSRQTPSICSLSAVESFNDYKRDFEQRTVLLENIPQLQMWDIDVDACLSFTARTRPKDKGNASMDEADGYGSREDM